MTNSLLRQTPKLHSAAIFRTGNSGFVCKVKLTEAMMVATETLKSTVSFQRDALRTNIMPELKVDLTNYPERFAEDSRELSIVRSVNFCFGRNGSGKTTIAEAIKFQHQCTYDIYTFDGFEGIVGENHRLDAVALGSINADIQTAIDEIDAEIASIKSMTEEPTDNSQNLFTSLEDATRQYEQKKQEIGTFYTDSARAIKNKANPQIAKTSYSRREFEAEMGEASSLSEDEINERKNIVSSKKKDDVSEVVFPVVDFRAYLDSVNEILLSSIPQSHAIEELENNVQRQNFAKKGTEIHSRDDSCFFCGNVISEERWKLLGEYFNDNVKVFEQRINGLVRELAAEATHLSRIESLNKDIFYPKFSNDISTLNLQLRGMVDKCRIFLDTLSAALNAKQENLFAASRTVNIETPLGFGDIEIGHKRIVDEHNALSQILNDEQVAAQKTLRLHEIKVMLSDFNFNAKCGELAALEARKDYAEAALSAKMHELTLKMEEKGNLISQTKNEEQIAKRINDCLASTGATSFTLELIEEDIEGQKGQYQILGHNGTIRAITELSKGEKNIIAFLYFAFSLEEPNTQGKNKIVVLDDPMTSNDDTMQYLMMIEAQKLYEQLSDGDFFILMTHNCHFYLNVRKQKKKFYKTYGNYHLLSDGKLTSIRGINNGNDDFQTNYEMLWKELVFLYERDKPNLMLSSCRKICETYQKFNNIAEFYKDSLAAQKLFHVNQHSIDDLEAEQNAKTREEIKSVLEEVFSKNEASEHFNARWTELESPCEE